MVAYPDPSFWRGKRVLVTGHTGFKGGWLSLWLYQLGAEVSGISLHPATQPNLFELARIHEHCQNYFCDLGNEREVYEVMQQVRPDIVFHLAAQPLVRAGYRDPIGTYQTNVMGTVHLLEALRHIPNPPRVIVLITTDKVYKNREWVWPYRENDALGGHDPYSASKAAAELIIESYRKAFFAPQGIAVASARAGNVIGGGDWSEDRLIPDAVRAWTTNQTLYIRNPDAVRPWQHVLEPLSGYLALATSLWGNPDMADAYNFGPYPSSFQTVRELVKEASTYFNGQWEMIREEGAPHEAGLLTLSIEKAATVLDWRPRWSFSEGIRKTMEWYRAVYDDTPALHQMLWDIEDFYA